MAGPPSLNLADASNWQVAVQLRCTAQVYGSPQRPAGGHGHDSGCGRRVVTAAAAFGGSGLTAIVNLRSTRLQNEQQLALAREERTERRVEALRKSRRDAYVRFLPSGGRSVRAEM